MKTAIRAFFALICLSALVACTSAPKDKVVDVVAKDFQFQVADSIPSGWTHFRFINAGKGEHFFLLDLLPASASFEDYRDLVAAPFQVVMDSLNAGMSREDALNMLVKQVPSWYFTSVKQMGGVGIVSPGMTTSVTLNLPPGNYAMECYIKQQGVFHTTLGMMNPLTVTAEVSKTVPPEANMDLSLSNFSYATKGDVKRGKNTFAVHFLEQPANQMGNDIHIIKLDEGTTTDDVIPWLDWMNIQGMEPPAPCKFYGGVQEMPVGKTAYFTAYLEPGHYAFIAESAAAQGMVKEFTVD